jgi:hypothetical protein
METLDFLMNTNEESVLKDFLANPKQDLSILIKEKLSIQIKPVELDQKYLKEHF